MSEDLQHFAEAWEAFLNTQATGFRKGDCYENAARFVLAKPAYDGSEVVLVHAQVHSPEAGWHGHAWLEWGDGVGLVLDPSCGEPTVAIFLPASYYRTGKVRKVRRFTPDEARRQMLKSKTFGPWREE